MTILNDASRMPWGKYQGEMMADVPASYLIWLYEEKKCSGEVLQYIKDNLDMLRLEIKTQRK